MGNGGFKRSAARGDAITKVEVLPPAATPPATEIARQGSDRSTSSKDPGTSTPSSKLLLGSRRLQSSAKVLVQSSPRSERSTHSQHSSHHSDKETTRSPRTPKSPKKMPLNLECEPCVLPGEVPTPRSLADSFYSDDRATSPMSPRSNRDRPSLGSNRSFRRSFRTKERIRISGCDSPTVKSKASADETRTRFVDLETQRFLTSVMKKHFLFGTLPEADYASICVHMHNSELNRGDVVYQPGDVGDRCYFIRLGKFAVVVDGMVSHELGPGDTFGELALLYQMKRSQTVSCTSKAGELWQMEHAQFKKCMENLSSRQSESRLDFFRSDSNFVALNAADHQLLAYLCTEVSFQDGDRIMDEGLASEHMYIVKSGTVTSSPKAGGDSMAEDFVHGPGWTLGSYGLLYGKQEEITARAVGDVVCLKLRKTALGTIPTSIEDVLRRCSLKSLLAGLPKGSDFFQHLSADQLHRLTAAAEEATFEENELVLAPGDPAQLILVIDGEVAVLSETICEVIDNDRFVCPPGTELRRVANMILREGMGYGDEPEFRSGRVMACFGVALGSVRVHRISYHAAMHQLGESVGDVLRKSEIKRVLYNVFLFKNLRPDQMDRMVRKLRQQRFAAGEAIVRQDDPAKHFFLIQSGSVKVSQGQSVLRTLGRWDYFGERGLLLQERRSATCEAIEACICLVLDADIFFQIVGMFRKELERRMYLQDLNITMADLKCQAVVGRGAFGVVRLVCHRSEEQKHYALKSVKKSHVVKNQQEKSIVMEREVNAQCYHPCIVQFIKTFQDSQYVYFLTEFLGGGDLFLAIRSIGILTKQQAQFFAGSIVLGVEYLHARSIMYRDLKPENVLLDFSGRAKLVDFGCCKKCAWTSTLVGTPEYLAPEVILGTGYGCACDWWSLGVMLFEFIAGPLPFGADTEDQATLFREILEAPLTVPGYVVDRTAIAVLTRMLEKKAHRRLGGGARHAKDIKEHCYWESFSWDALAGGFFEAPWRPDMEVIRSGWEPPDGALGKGTPASANELGMDWAKVF